MKSTPRNLASFGAIALLTLAATAFGASATTHAVGGTTAPSSDADYDELIAAATEEGKVTFYASLRPEDMETVASMFEEKYPGIDVDPIRSLPAEITARVDTELETDTAGGDLVIVALPSWMETHNENGDWLPLSPAPAFDGQTDYDVDAHVQGGAVFEATSTILTVGWNTDELPDGLEDYTDLLDPSLRGRIGIPDPTSGASIVDFYLWVESVYGDDFLEQLAAQEPKVYSGALQIVEGVTSGEVAASPYFGYRSGQEAAEDGAPVDSVIPPHGAYAPKYYGGIPKTSDHPNAARLFADFFLSHEAQAVVSRSAMSPVPDVEGAVANPEVFSWVEPSTPEVVEEFVARWTELFR